MQRIIFLYTLVMPIASESWSPIEDIPIESFQPQEYQESDVDHEFLLRPSRTVASSLSEADLKEQFFRSFDDEIYPESELADLPRPGGFLPYRSRLDSSEVRPKRQATEEPFVSQTIRISSDIEDELGTAPLELDTLNPVLVTNVSTEPIPSTTDTVAPEESSKSNLILINDFIRFRRGLGVDTEADKAGAEEEKGENRPKRDRQIMKKSTKLSLENDREPHSSTREEWVKFPYQLRPNNEPFYDDSYASGSDLIKAPRVHFVTQRRSETIDNPLVYRNERQGRYSDLPREARGNTNIRDKEVGLIPRYGGRYDVPPEYPQLRYDPRREDFRGRYNNRDPLDDRRYSPPPPSPNYSGNRQRRIIYYANLPEITRSPPSVDFRDRYRYRDGYDDRYAIEPYQMKVYGKPRFDETDRTKPSYPFKVSTDVNVREVKKNPERRIYSEVERKFGYNVPSFNHNQGDARH